MRITGSVDIQKLSFGYIEEGLKNSHFAKPKLSITQIIDFSEPLIYADLPLALLSAPVSMVVVVFTECWVDNEKVWLISNEIYGEGK